MNPELRKKLNITIVPFKLRVDNVEYVDNKDLDVNNFIDIMVNAQDLPKSSCPSPQDFLEAYQGADNVFVVTISKALSGTYNSAILAKKLFEEENPDKFVHVFNSKGASTTELLTSMKIQELVDQGKSNEEIVSMVEAYIEQIQTFFVSENLDNLIKNGRISLIKGKLATAFKIRPVMGANDEGEIELYAKARGNSRAYKKLIELIDEAADNQEERLLAISHVNNPTRAEKLKKEISQQCQFKDIIIVPTGGLSSLYCDNQGIIVTF
jgi:DegV family protein with EDD domain